MLIPDLILLAVVLALAAWRLFAPAWQPRLRVAGVAPVSCWRPLNGPSATSPGRTCRPTFCWR